MTGGQRQTLAIGALVAAAMVAGGYPGLHEPAVTVAGPDVPGTTVAEAPTAAPTDGDPTPDSVAVAPPPPIALPTRPAPPPAVPNPPPAEEPDPPAPEPTSAPSPAPTPLPPAPGPPTPGGPVPGAVEVPPEFEPLTLAIGDLVVGGCAMHNSNVTGAVIVFTLADLDGSILEVLYVPGDQCFVLGASGTRTTCDLDTSLDAVPIDLSAVPLAGPPPLVGGLVGVLSGLDQVLDGLGVDAPEFGDALRDALGCETAGG